MRINNNMSAVITNNQLLGTEGSLADVMEKLSTGFSINHASDNPSGIAIAGKMQAQIEGLAQASTNSSDGISVLQTAEGALNEVTDMIQRMRELSVQAANGTNSISERKTIQKEIDSLLEEIDRVAETTEFNNINLLNGALDNRTYADHATRIQTSNEVPAGPYQLTINQAATQATVGGVAQLLNGATELAEGGTININGHGIELSQGMSKQAVYEALRDGCENGGAMISDCLQDTVNVAITSIKYGVGANLKIDFSSKEFAVALGFDPNEILLEADGESIGETGPLMPGETALANDGYISINGHKVALTTGMTREQVYEAMKKACDSSDAEITDCHDGVATMTIKTTRTNAEVELIFSSREFAEELGFDTDRMNSKAIAQTVGSDPEVELTVDTGNHKVSMFGNQATCKYDGNHITVTDVGGFEFSFLAEAGFDKNTDTNTDDAQKGKINFNVTDIGSMTLHVGANKGQNMEVRIAAVTTEFMYIDDLNVTRVHGAEDAMDYLDKALSYVTGVRSQLGAYENRLDHTTKSLDTTEENMTSAISRIEDADMATTMVEYTKLNVLEQAGTSALAQANELPQLALQLLQ